MNHEELKRLAELVAGGPLGPDTWKLAELMTGIDTECSRLGRRPFAVILVQQWFDMDGLTDYVFLRESFESLPEAISSVDEAARELLTIQTSQPDAQGMRWVLESSGDVRSLPNARSGLWATESGKGTRSHAKSKVQRKLRTLHDRTFKVRASEFDAKYSCFRVVGVFADQVVCDELFEFVNSRQELWSYFVEVGEAKRSGKPMPVPQ